MRSLTPAEVVDAWERGLDRSLPERMLVLLDAACPEVTYDQLAALPLGRRDGLLFELRALLFGPELTGVSECPACGETVESSFHAAALQVPVDAPAAALHHVEVGGTDVAFRLPSSDDVITVAAGPDASATTRLLERCLDDPAHLAGLDVEWQPLASAVTSAMSTADPLADVVFALDCPACAETWPAPFDIAAFLWAEIHGWVHRLLRDVDQLGRAYGWREADVLELSATRRSVYLELTRR